MDVLPDDVELMKGLFDVVRSLVDEFDLETAGYRLIVNGGVAQDVKLLHFHLVSAVSVDELSN